MSPTVLQVRGHRVMIYTNEGAEPAHVHVWQAGREAKVWLRPVAVAYARGFSEVDVHFLRRLIEDHRDTLEELYYGIHPHTRPAAP